ncbi:MAG: hypothetical protein LWW85_13750, partial [Marinilabiliales bacterium]|nr:hypothetical protein [Marinilabiliales bacterium]
TPPIVSERNIGFFHSYGKHSLPTRGRVCFRTGSSFHFLHRLDTIHAPFCLPLPESGELNHEKH